MFLSDPSAESTERLNPELFRSELQALYAALETDIRQAGPSCALSGRCCRFAEYGHTLFLSSVEFAVLLSDAPPAIRPVDDGASCPWQDDGGRCTARAARPLGCRVYYCDESYQDRGQDLSERSIAQLKDLARRHGLPWHYAPLHHHLRVALASGTLAAPQPDPSRGPVPPVGDPDAIS